MDLKDASENVARKTLREENPHASNVKRGYWGQQIYYCHSIELVYLVQVRYPRRTCDKERNLICGMGVATYGCILESRNKLGPLRYKTQG